MTAPSDAPEDPIGDLAQRILDAVVSTFAAAGIELPKRRVITSGELAVDAEVLGVIYGGTHVGPPGNEIAGPVRADVPRSASFSVEIWRDITLSDSRGNAPSADAITTEARIAMIDSWYLLDAAYTVDAYGVGVIASASPDPPQGDLQGVHLELQLQVP